MNNEIKATMPSAGIMSGQSPKPVYNIGDTVKFINYGYRLEELRTDENNLSLMNGQQVIEVEIKDVKTARVILEYPVRNIYDEQAKVTASQKLEDKENA